MNRWIDADDLRESWCFLVVDAGQGSDSSYAKAWALGDANAEQLLETDHHVIRSEEKEEELLTQLGKELDARRYQDTLLITPTQRTISFLRARFLDTDAVTRPTFRGFRYVAINKLLTEHVDTSATNEWDVASKPYLQRGVTGEEQFAEETVVERLWELRVKLGPLLPADALRGILL